MRAVRAASLSAPRGTANSRFRRSWPVSMESSISAENSGSGVLELLLQERGQPAHHLARGVGVHVARQRAKARHLRHQRAEGGDALGAERAFAVLEREAQQAAAHVVAFELDQHALGEVAPPPP